MVRIPEVLGTRIACADRSWAPAATTVTFDPAAAAKIGGVLPTPPMSMAFALAASRSGGPEVNCDQVILYLTPVSWPAARSRTCDPAFWSPTRSVTFVRSTEPSLRMAAASPFEASPQPAAVTSAAAVSRANSLFMRFLRRRRAG